MHAPSPTPTPQMVLVLTTDWTNVVIALATVAMAAFSALLVVGVGIAVAQLVQDRKFNQALQTGNIIAEWSAPDLRSMRRRIDYSEDYDENRSRVEQEYYLLKHSANSSWDKLVKFIDDTGELGERIWLYIEKRLVDADMIYRHLGYDILSTYYHLQDILAARTRDEDMLYDAFRRLVLATQEYAKRYPAKLDVRVQLVDAKFPELVSKLDEPKPAKGGDDAA